MIDVNEGSNPGLLEIIECKANTVFFFLYLSLKKVLDSVDDDLDNYDFWQELCFFLFVRF